MTKFNPQIETLLIKIKQECESFEKKTGYNVDLNEIIFAYGNKGYILNDWNEGKDNDPFWNEELNEHSAIVFINEMTALIHKEFE